MPKLVISPEAMSDMQEIGDFIARDNLLAAASFVERIWQRCNDLLAFPSAGRKRDEIKAGYRSVTEGDYVIFYRLADNSVEVLRVWHGKRDTNELV